MANGRSQLFEDLGKYGLGGDSKCKGPKVETRTTKKILVADAYDGEERRGPRISTNCKCTADILPQDVKWKFP